MSGSCGWFPLRPDQIQAWVARHAHDLPRTLPELSALPIPFRKAIVAAVEPDVRVALWRSHLESFLAPSAELTDAQRALVRDAMHALPAMFGTLERGQRDDAEGSARALEDRMRTLITREQAGRIFGTLGPPEPPEGLPIPADALA